LKAAFSTTSGPWKAQRNIVELNEGFRVVDELGGPIRGLFALMIVFGIAIGPANFIVLSRKNRRIWLLWTVPVLSAMFCLMGMGYMIAAEGCRGDVRAAGV